MRQATEYSKPSGYPEIAKVRKSDLDFPNGRVLIGERQNPLCDWGQQMIRQFLQIRPLVDKNLLLAVR